MNCVPIDMLPTRGPLLPTQCPLLPTQCPLLPTQCPLLPTQCPLLPTQGPLLPTQGPLLPTQCPLLPTQGPLLPTQCPLLPTQGPLLPTQGPLLPTQGPLLPTPWAGKSAEVYFGNIHSWICAAQRLHARTSVTSYTSVNIYNFNSRLAHFSALWMEYIRSLRAGIMEEYPDVHFAGHLRSNRTNIWSDKSNIRHMQSGGARGLELRTAELHNSRLKCWR